MNSSWVCIVCSLLVCFSGISDATYQEMTHVMDMETMMMHPVYFEEKYHFTYRIDQAGPQGDAPFVAWNSYATVEHMGTHFDAPYHFFEDGRQTHEIPLEDLHGPLVRIDIRDKVAVNNQSTVDIEDLLEWEERYGIIPERAFILMDSGWSQHWGDQLSYVGADQDNPDESKLAWPSFSPETVMWLLENRNFLGIGGDVISCDLPRSDIVHIILLPEDKVCLENLYNTDKVPDSGAEFYFFPLLIKGGTGGQIRAYAFWDTELYTGGTTLIQSNVMLLFLLMAFGFVFK